MTEIDTQLSKMTLEQKFAFAILCSMEVCDGPEWTMWARGWLSGEDRSRESARGAMSGLDGVSNAPAWAAARAVSSDHPSVAAWAAVYAASMSQIMSVHPLDVTDLAQRAMEVK